MKKLIFETIKKIRAFGAIRNKPWQLWLFFLITVVSILILFITVDLSPHVDGDFFFSSDDPQFQHDRTIAKVFPQQSSQLIISAKGDIRSDEYLERVSVLTQVISYIPGVSSVKSLSSGPKNLQDTLNSPLWRRLLISDNEQSSNFIVVLEDVAPQTVIPKFEEAMDLLSASDFELKISGVPYIVESIRRSLFNDLKVFSTLAFIIFGIVIFLIFRSVKIFLGTIAACINACVLTLIIANIFGIKIGILTVNLSTIIFVLTLSHIIFLTHNWRIVAQESGPGRSDYVIQAVRLTLGASFWCMVTTLLGFLSLLFVQAKPLRELGVSGAIGTLAAIGVAYGIYPLFLRSVRPKNRVIEDIEHQGVYSFFLGRSRWAVAVVLLLAIFSFAGLAKIDTDPSLFSYFAQGKELRDGLEYIDRNGGSSPLKLVLRDAAGGKLTNNENYKRLWSLQEALENDKAVGSIISLPVLMAEGSRAPLAFLLDWEGLLRQMNKPEHNRIARSFVTDDRISGYFFLRMKESYSDVSRLEVVDRIKQTVRDYGFVPEMTGGVYLLQGELSRLVASSLVYGLGKLIFLFIFVAWLVSRSIRISLAMVLGLCIIPICMLGIIGYLGIPLDIISAPAANVAIAMGIDSMIHMVIFVRRRLRKGVDTRLAWDQAQHNLWEPIFGSMFIICAGFGIFSISSFPPTQRFGGSIVFGTIIAAVTALFVLPYLAQLKWIKKINPKRKLSKVPKILNEPDEVSQKI
jgi:predicted RND superfamily exporter protein